MSDELVVDATVTSIVRPCLAAGARLQVDRLSGKTVLLFPEGMLQLNATGSAILELCDGQRAVDELVMLLAKRFDVAPAVIHGDVIQYLHRLQRRGLISSSPQHAPNNSALQEAAGSGPR